MYQVVMAVVLSLTTVQLVCTAQAAASDMTVLVEAGRRETFIPRKGYDVEISEQAGRQANQLFWNVGVNTLNEAAFRTRPDLRAFASGITLEIDIHTDDFPDLKSAGVRVIDSMGEIHQYGKLTLPEGDGWKTWRVDLSPERVTDRWGGGEEGKGQVDPPVKLLSLLFNAPQKPDQRRSILVGEIRRNAVNPQAVEPQFLLDGLNLTLETGHPISLIFKGEEDRLQYRIRHEGQMGEVTFRLKLAVSDDRDHRNEWSSQVITLAPGGTMQLPLRAALPGFGWYRLEPTFELADGSAGLTRPGRQVAYVDPVGPRPLPPQENFWFGLDSRVRDPEVLALLPRLGVDILRYGTWDGVHRGDQNWDWTTFDRDVTRIRELGMHILYSFTFTPAFAVKPEYRQRHAAGEKIGGRPISLNIVAPQPEILRDAVRAIVERNKRYDVMIYDLWNEPDLSGFWQGTTDEYLEFMRICHEQIKKVHPQARVLTGGIATISGHGGHALNPDLIERMIVEGQDHYDAISVHQHGDFRVFHEGLDGVLAAHRATLRSQKPLWFTETGFNGDPKRMGHVLVQKFALARARGAEGFIWYALYPPGRGNGYSMTDRHGDPLPVIPAYNEMVRQMRGKQFDRQLDVGKGNWVLSFTSEDDTLLIGWDEDAVVSGQQVLVVLPKGASARRYDLMGRESPVTVIDGVAIWTMTRDVAYLRITKGRPQVLGSLGAFAEEPFGEPGQKTTIVATLRNPLDREVQFDLTWTDHDGSERPARLTVAAREQAQATFETIMPSVQASHRPHIALAYRIPGTDWSGKASVALNAARRIPAPRTTPREPDFTLATPANIHNANEADPTRAAYTWKGPQDLSAKVWLGLEERHLLLTVEVHDNRHHQPQSAGSSWQADGLQVAFAIPGRSGHWLIGLARSNDGKSLVHAWSAPVGLSPNYVSAIELQTQRRDEVTRYHARLPLEGFGADASFLRNRAISFNLLVNDDDDDGGGRKGFAYIVRSLGFGKAEPQEWPMITFE